MTVKAGVFFSGMARPATFFVRLCALVVLGMAGPSVRAAGESGTFAVISDIHFNPFAPPKDQATSRIGEDTNHALLTSGLATFARAMASADFAIVPGDLLAHGFNAKAAAALGVDPSSPAVDDMAAKTTLFVADALAEALGGKPAFVALGNEDSKCGDYKVEPGGPYLAATREAVRRLVGAERLEADFAETWAAAGYYAARHPTVANGLIVVLNDVMWSPQYQDTCGSNGLAAAAGHDELAAREAGAAARGRRPGLAGASHPLGNRCLRHDQRQGPVVSGEGRSVPEGAVRVRASGAADGVSRRDPGELLGPHPLRRLPASDRPRGTVVGLDKLTPALSPIFGQNPGFQVFTYDKQTGAPTDFSTWHLTNPGAAAEAADWRLEYTFTEAYRQPRYAPDIVGTLWQAMMKGGAVRDTYRRLYKVGRGELSADGLAAYLCAIGHTDVASFTTCYCGDRR